ncbi:pirin family protein [Anaerosphaera multitolerans]|uniref:Pirin family protein n=1 Tax=Anaerosphaera multitolerans TaxID=2487351 RepID=A0A437S5H3_9FIRM|nr:pirin-like bicupin family protein [Anaerosphaera multitolerans]RVU54259.1 pirin family protein [Anaerosphaera multitolerans]
MLKYIDSNNMGQSGSHWLKSIHHFSFSSYYNPDNMNFGVLRAINDDVLKPHSGFDTHNHKDMEILSYVVKGELTHKDSMSNKRTLSRGQVQYMSAGTGVSHSEHNLGKESLRFLQIWIYPDKKGYETNYGDLKFSWEERKDKWLAIASGDGNSKFPIQINSDVHIYVTEITEGKTLNFKIDKNRQAYLVQIEGHSTINSLNLKEGDALEIVEEELEISAKTNSHILIIEMAKPI